MEVRARHPSLCPDADPPRLLVSSMNWSSAQITVSSAVFERFQKLIYRETGIWLGGSKTALLCGRFARRLRALGLPTLAEYYSVVSDPEQQQERALMIDAITTNETRFFREPVHFEFLAHSVFPIWHRQAEEGRRPKKIRVWSAGCSSGEEPYSLAMLLAKSFPAIQGWECQVLATDISRRMLATARDAIYGITKSRDIPAEFLHRYMLKGSAEQEGNMKVSREIRQMVDFQWLNLSRKPYPISGTFDAVFCRNVLIYFDAASRYRVVENLLEYLSPDGLFFSGHAESLHGVTSCLQPILPTVYAVPGHDSIAHDLQIHSSS